MKFLPYIFYEEYLSTTLLCYLCFIDTRCSHRQTTDYIRILKLSGLWAIKTKNYESLKIYFYQVLSFYYLQIANKKNYCYPAMLGLMS